MCYRRQFLRKMWPVQLPCLCFIVCGIFLSTLTLCNTYSFHMIDPTYLHPSTAPHFHNFPGISDTLSKVSKFQHHTKLCSKCSKLLVSSLNLSPVWLVNGAFFLVEWCLCCDGPWFNFMCTSDIICFHAIQIIKIFYIPVVFDLA